MLQWEIPQSGQGHNQEGFLPFPNKNFAEKTRFYRFAVQTGQYFLRVRPEKEARNVGILVLNIKRPRGRNHNSAEKAELDGFQRKAARKVEPKDGRNQIGLPPWRAKKPAQKTSFYRVIV